HDSGYSATVEKYGLVDNIDDEKVKYRFTESNFTVYNAGNVTVEPESMFLEIRCRFVQAPDGFSIINNTTGDVFEFNYPVNGSHIVLDRMNVRYGSVNGFRYSNRRFIGLTPGNNEFEIIGATFESISINFKFLYK